MTITLSGSHSVPADAPWGTVIGTFNSFNVRLQSVPGYFGITGNTLRSAWQGVIAKPGLYTIVTHAWGGPPASFDITITPVTVTPPPSPKSVMLTPASATAPATAAAGLALSTAAVAMSDGSAFTGHLSTPGTTMVTMSGPTVVTKRALTAADVGTHKFTVQATQSGGSATATLLLTVTAAAGSPPPPPVPATVQVNGSSNPVSVSAGAGITATVANGPGNPTDWLGVYAVGSASGSASPASWKYLENDNTLKPAAGVSVGTVHLAVPSSDGDYEVRLFANNGFTALAKSPTVTARTLVMTLAPVPSSFPDNTAAGAVITTATVKYSNGSTPKTVQLTSSDPTFVAAKGLQLVFARALTTQDDGTHSVTITASDGIGAIATARLFGGGSG